MEDGGYGSNMYVWRVDDGSRWGIQVWMDGGWSFFGVSDRRGKQGDEETDRAPEDKGREGKDGMGPGRNTRRSRCKRFTDLEPSTRQDKTRQDDGRNQGSAEGEEKNDDDDDNNNDYDFDERKT